MRAVIYSRVSTRRQETSNQTEVLTSLAKRRGFDLIAIYQENESAWKTGHQRKLGELLDKALRKEFDIVLVWALDRLSREGPLAILKLVDKLNKLKVGVLSYQEPWTEAAGPLADLLYALTGWVAQAESQRRSERVKAGLARRRNAGKTVGRKPGSKDRRPRRRAGYYLRHARQKSAAD